MITKLKNEHLKIEIKDFGAELSSIKNCDSFEYLWQADSKYWGRHSPVLFPIVGNLLDNEYSYKDKTYTLNQHGFARDNEFKVVEQKENFVSYVFESNEETEKNYPFIFKLIISYELIENSIIVSYKVQNNTNDEMFFSIGTHPAFNWPLESNLKKEDYTLNIDLEKAKHYKIFKDGVNEVENSFDTKEIFLSEYIFEEDALIFSDIEDRNICYKSDKSSKSVSIDFENFPYLGIWSKPTGSPFICLEPWCGIADFNGHDKKLENKKGIIKLQASDSFEASYTITIK